MLSRRGVGIWKDFVYDEDSRVALLQSRYCVEEDFASVGIGLVVEDVAEDV